MPNHNSEGLESYYKHFEVGGNGMTFENILNAVANNRQKFSALFRTLAENQPLNTLIVGSATARNLGYLSKFLSENRRQNPQDRIALVDKTQMALDMHSGAEAAEMSPKPELKLGDVNNLPYQNGSMSLVLADCTLNLSIDFYSLERSVQEISRVLKNQGLLLGSIVTRLEQDLVESPGSRNYLVESPGSRNLIGEAFPRTYFPLRDLQRFTLKSNLYPRGDIVEKPNQGSEVEVTYFLMQKVEPKQEEPFTYSE
jgi:SAM-dependent methyltransferase